ncbi:MAG: glucosyltransferase domain-containing protein [Desulfovibrio sp.]|nr:glucosyltransferase domain-containing protein [Desulfovibrio sp.]
MKLSLLFSRLRGTQAFILLFSLYCVGSAGILRADRLYLDDMGRALYGYADMAQAGRPLADLLSALFYLHSGTVDASPFSLFAAAGLTAGAALLLCRALRIRLTPAVVAACLPFGLGPYGLENLSYRFDAPLTAAGVLFAVLPFCRLRGKHFFVPALLCVFASASIYQPCLNVYAAVAVFLVLRNLSRGKAGSAALALRVGAPLLCASALYALQLPFWLTDYQYGDYVAAHSAVPGPGLLPAAAAANIRAYFALLYADWSVNALGPLLFLAVAALGAASAARLLRRRSVEALRQQQRAEQKPPNTRGNGQEGLKTRPGGRERANARRTGPGPAALVALPALLLCLIAAPLGVQVVLSSPVWSPRTLLAFGPVLTLVLLGITPAGSAAGTNVRRAAGTAAPAGSAPATNVRRAAGTAAVVLILLIDVQLLIVASLYGNMLSAQNRWEQARFAELAPALAAFAAENNSDRVIFAGGVGYSPLMDVPGRRFPLIRRMTVVPLTRDMRWGYEQLAVYGIAARPGKVPAEGDILRPHADTPFFRLDATADGEAFVTFKRPPARRPHPGSAENTQ